MMRTARSRMVIVIFGSQRASIRPKSAISTSVAIARRATAVIMLTVQWICVRQPLLPQHRTPKRVRQALLQVLSPRGHDATPYHWQSYSWIQRATSTPFHRLLQSRSQSLHPWHSHRCHRHHYGSMECDHRHQSVPSAQLAVLWVLLVLLEISLERCGHRAIQSMCSLISIRGARNRAV